MTDMPATLHDTDCGTPDRKAAGISVIANFYNSEKYIPKLVKSLLAQTFENWELIAVNDCSPGNDLKVLEKYAVLPAMRGRMRIIDNPVNQGISRAKATGIKAASREYLTFIDGDDWLEPTALEKMHTAAETNRLDIVMVECYRALPFYRKKCRSAVKYNHVYDRQGIRDELIEGFFGISVFSSYAYWGKMYRRDLIDRTPYTPRQTAMYEDVFFNLYALLEAERFMILDEGLYNWRWGGISSGSVNKSEASFGLMAVVRNFNDFYRERVDVINALSFQKALRPLKIELYNILRVSFGKMCSYKPGSEEARQICGLIREAIALPAYMELRGKNGIEDFIHPDFIHSLEKQDVEWLYSFFHDIYKSNRTPRVMRRILSWIVK